MTRAMKTALVRTLTAGCHGLATCAPATARALHRAGLVRDEGPDGDVHWIRLRPEGFARALRLAAAHVAGDPHDWRGYGLTGLAETLRQLDEDKFLQD